MKQRDPLFLLGDRDTLPKLERPVQVIENPADADRAFADHARGVWVATSTRNLHVLFEIDRRETEHRLVVLSPVSAARRTVLGAVFDSVLTSEESIQLPADELADVLDAEYPEDFVVAGVIDQEDSRIMLVRGDLERLVVPFSWFTPSGGASPDFDDFEVTDSGQTLRFGAYEAAVSALLYELDPIARRRMKERARDKDRSLGGALRRLRIQRGLSQDDFPDISGKTIGRIERNEHQPRTETLRVIAKKLGVSPEEIESF